MSESASILVIVPRSFAAGSKAAGGGGVGEKKVHGCEERGARKERKANKLERAHVSRAIGGRVGDMG